MPQAQGDLREGIETQIGDIVARLARRLRRGSARRLVPLGLSDGQARLLRVLGRTSGSLHMSEVARRLGIVPRSATSLVECLEKKGLVVREIDPADRRSVFVRATPQGQAVLSTLANGKDEVSLALFGQLSVTDRAELLRILTRIDVDDIDKKVSLANRANRRSAQP